MNFITPSQCRAARGLLNWSQPGLAKKCGMHAQTISAFEHETSTPTKTTLEKIRVAFEDSGIGFGKNDSIYRTSTNIRTLTGQKGFREFYEDIYEEIEKSKPKFIYVSNVDERKFIRGFGSTPPESHINKMQNAKIKYKILVEEGDTYFPGSAYAEYRWTPKDSFFSVPFYIYGSKVAMIIFGTKNIRIYILNEPEITKLHKAQFESLWKKSTKPRLKAA